MAAADDPSEPPTGHPNTPRRAALWLAFLGIVVTGLLGGTIGWGLVDTTCTESPTIAQRLLDDLPAYDMQTQSCDLRLLGGALAGTLVAAIGAGVVAGLMLRAQSEWRAHPPATGPRGGPPQPVSRARSGGRPRRT